jgi:hypothetical protein
MERARQYRGALEEAVPESRILELKLPPTLSLPKNSLACILGGWVYSGFHFTC